MSVRPSTGSHGPPRLPWQSCSSAGTFLWGSRQASNKATVQEETNRGCAILTHVVNAEWLDDDNSRRTGDTVSAGTLKLACGFAQVEFQQGDPAHRSRCRARDRLPLGGRLSLWERCVQVPPPARGFLLHAPA